MPSLCPVAGSMNFYIQSHETDSRHHATCACSPDLPQGRAVVLLSAASLLLALNWQPRWTELTEYSSRPDSAGPFGIPATVVICGALNRPLRRRT